MIDSRLQVSVMESAEKVAEHWTEFSILVIDNDFGAGMTGSQLIQLIRNAEKEDDKKKFIILWSADDDLENPGADLMWDRPAGRWQTKVSASFESDLLSCVQEPICMETN